MTSYNDSNRQIKYLNFILACILIYLIAISHRSTLESNTNFGEITVRKLTLVDSLGTIRFELTTDLATAHFAGEEIERNVPANMAGMVFLNPDGDEVGGIAFGGEDDGLVGLSVIDYSGIPLEAIGIRRIQTPDLTTAQFVVMDNPGSDMVFDVDAYLEELKSEVDGPQIKALQSQMVPRIGLGVENHTAGLTIADQEGRSRIVIEVKDNKPVFRILDENGDVVYDYLDE